METGPLGVKNQIGKAHLLQNAISKVTMETLRLCHKDQQQQGEDYFVT